MSDYLNKGKSLLVNKEFSKALEFFQAALENIESPKEAYLGLAETYFALSKDEQGKVALFKAMALDPNNPQGISMIKHHCIPVWEDNNSPVSSIPNNHQCLDPVISIKPHTLLGRNHYVAEQQSGNKLYFKVGAKGCTIVCPTDPSVDDGWNGYNKPKGDVVIPEKLNVNNKILDVIAIDEFVFDENKTITSVCLPNTIQRIKGCAFWNASISNILLPSALQHIEDRAFSETLLEEISIPDSCKTIGNNCFSKCYRLSEVKLNNGLLNVGDYAFEGCDLHEIDIPDSVTEIGYAAFPSGTIIRLHGNPPKFDWVVDGDRYTIFVPHSKKYLYEEDEDWEYVKINTY